MSGNFWTSRQWKAIWEEPASSRDAALSPRLFCTAFDEQVLGADLVCDVHHVAVELLYRMHDALRLHYDTRCTACVLLKRFYAVRSICSPSPDLRSVIAASLFLASKVEELPLASKQLLVVANHVLAASESVADPEKDNTTFRHQDAPGARAAVTPEMLYSAEREVLRALDYSLIVFHPLEDLHRLCHAASFSNAQSHCCFTVLNDSYLTHLSLQVSPHMLARAVIVFAVLYYPDVFVSGSWGSLQQRRQQLDVMHRLSRGIEQGVMKLCVEQLCRIRAARPAERRGLESLLALAKKLAAANAAYSVKRHDDRLDEDGHPTACQTGPSLVHNADEKARVVLVPGSQLFSQVPLDIVLDPFEQLEQSQARFEVHASPRSGHVQSNSERGREPEAGAAHEACRVEHQDCSADEIAASDEQRQKDNGAVNAVTLLRSADHEHTILPQEAHGIELPQKPSRIEVGGQAQGHEAPVEQVMASGSAADLVKSRGRGRASRESAAKILDSGEEATTLRASKKRKVVGVATTKADEMSAGGRVKKRGRPAKLKDEGEPGPGSGTAASPKSSHFADRKTSSSDAKEPRPVGRKKMKRLPPSATQPSSLNNSALKQEVGMDTGQPAGERILMEAEDRAHARDTSHAANGALASACSGSDESESAADAPRTASLQVSSVPMSSPDKISGRHIQTNGTVGAHEDPLLVSQLLDSAEKRALISSMDAGPSAITSDVHAAAVGERGRSWGRGRGRDRGHGRGRRKAGAS